MKILHLSFSFTQGGIDNMMNDIMHYEVIQNHNVSLMILNNHIDEKVFSLLPSNIKTYRIGRSFSSKNPWYILKMLFIINFIIKPDIIHCHNGNMGKFMPFILCKSVLTVHAMNYNTKYYKYFDSVIGISKSVKNDILKTFKANNISYIYNGIDFNLIKKKYQSNSNTIYKIICVGRLDHITKGQDILIEAMAEISKQTSKQYHLDLVGDGKSREYLESLVHKYNLSEKVSFLGNQKRSWVYKHISEYNLLVQPSRHEGFGLTLVEGIAAYTPVLASDIDGPKEILKNGEIGFLFSSENKESLSKKILEISQLPDSIIKEKLEHDFHFMEMRYSIINTVNQYINLYNSIRKHENS